MTGLRPGESGSYSLVNRRRNASWRARLGWKRRGKRRAAGREDGSSSLEGGEVPTLEELPPSFLPAPLAIRPVSCKDEFPLFF